MTVAELIAELQKLDQGARIVITWESTIHDIDPDEVYVSRDGVVMLDADANFYKETYVQEGLDWQYPRSKPSPSPVASNAQAPSLATAVGMADRIPSEVTKLPEDPCVFELGRDVLFDADDVDRFIRAGGSIASHGFRIHTRKP